MAFLKNHVKMILSRRQRRNDPVSKATLLDSRMPGREAHFAQLLAEHQKTDEIPFDYARKIVSILVIDPNGEHQLIMKGDVAHIVSRCRYVAYRGEVLPMEDVGESVSSVVDEMLQDGMKVIAVARKNVGQQNRITPADEADMILVGYLAYGAGDQPEKSLCSSLRRAAVKGGAHDELEGYLDDAVWHSGFVRTRHGLLGVHGSSRADRGRDECRLLWHEAP